MATPTPPAAPTPPAPTGGGTNKILLGCGIGCAVLLLLFVVVAGIGYVKFVKPMVEQTQAMEEAQAKNEEALASLRSLDDSYPSSIGDSLDAAQLAASDIDVYIDLRTALAPEAEAAAAARERLFSAFDFSGLAGGNPLAGFSMMGDMFQGMRDMQESRGNLLRAANEELEAAGIGPTEFQRMVELVEWRFLQRDEALTVGLTAEERSEWMAQAFGKQFAEGILSASGGQASASDKAQFERQIEEAEERMAELEAAARERVDLNAATRQVLEARRSELQGLPARGVEDLASLSDSVNPGDWFSGMQGGFGP